MLAALVASIVLVHPQGGASQSFSNLQQALDAAVDGDLVFIDGGVFALSDTYRIDGKGIVLCARQGSNFELGRLIVENLDPHQQVVLQHVACALEVRACAGLVWSDAGAHFAPPLGATTRGVSVHDTARALFTRSNAAGLKPAACVDGGHAWEFVDSNAWLHGCAGSGADSGAGTASCGPYSGGDGLHVEGGTLTSVRGAFGGGTGKWITASGGDGLEVAGGALVHAVQTTLVGAAGGIGAPAGMAANVQSGVLTTASEPRHEIVVHSPTRDGHRMLFSVFGEPGSHAFVHVSLAPALQPIAGVGALHIDATQSGVVDFGVVPPGGVILRTYDFGDPGQPALIAYVQARFVHAGGVSVSNGQPVIVFGLGHWHP